MSDLTMVYHVGVQRWPLPLFKRYKVNGHQTELCGGSIPRLVLTCTDGSIVALPKLDRRRVKLYPDYKAEDARVKALKAQIAALAQERPAGPAIEG